MKTFVFLGPSLGRAQARAILDAEYLAPVAMGDLYALASTRAQPGDRIAIVDGLFEQVPAVWHKEVLYALQRGIHVYGGSSMGALRAAELHPFGMRGVGRIFEAYRDGTIEADDEVAVAHATAEQDYRPLSTAMAAIRFALADLRQAGSIDGAEHDALFAAARAMHYTVRSWGALLAHARGHGMRDTVTQALLAQARRPDAKAQDAAALLRLLAATPAAAPFQPQFMLEQTAFWSGLARSQDARLAHERHGAGQGQALDATVSAQVRAGHPEREPLLRQAALAWLAEGRTAGWQPGEPDLLAAAARIARRHGLRTAQAMAAWRTAQDLDPAGWRALLEREARVDYCVRQVLPALDGALAATLKLEGGYAAALAQAAAGRRRFGAGQAKALTLEDSGVAPEQLQAWYERRCGPMLPDPEAHAHALGFETLRDFIAEILVLYLLDGDTAAAA
jgi:hypothetical protein